LRLDLLVEFCQGLMSPKPFLLTSQSPRLQYELLKKEGKNACYSSSVTDILSELYRASITFLNTVDQTGLSSIVPGKEYFAFSREGKLSRPINSFLFDLSLENWESLQKKMNDNSFEKSDSVLIQKTLYSVAISFCACVDLLKTGDKKTPGTFFEYFVAYFFTWRVGTNPQNSIKILSLDEEDISLPTDYIYNLGKDKQKFHMPIKTSSRERSIMLWAHQKLLNGIYGEGRFMGTPVLLTETKLDKRKKEVTEICLPSQWRLYQFYIAKLTRIYYLDLPQAYQKLNDQFPPIAVREFSDFFFEWDELIPS